MLATTLHGLQGTPYVYQGEEIGMANPKWLDISEFNDIESTNMFKILQERGLSADEALAIIRERSRDNSRTPMQWDETANAGFTSGTPWLKVDESYKEINAKAQLGDPTSILAHYRKLIRLRKQKKCLPTDVMSGLMRRILRFTRMPGLTKPKYWSSYPISAVNM